LTRTSLILLMGLATAAAAPGPDLPIPPIPPKRPPTDVAAPVPDSDVRAPLVIASEDPRVQIRNFRVDRYDQSRGFLPGSRYESSEERKGIQTPGLSVTVPLR
jgi:hypothetical protein